MPSPPCRALAVVHAHAGEDLRDTLLDPRGSSLRLLRACEMQDVGPLSPGGQGIEGFREPAVLLQDLGQLLRNLELALRLINDFKPGFLHCDGLPNIGLHHGLCNLSLTGELQAHCRLCVLSLTAEQAVGVMEQGAFEEHEGAVRFEGLDDGHVRPLERVAGLAPLKVFVEPAIQEDRPQLLDLSAPRFGAAQECIYARIGRTYGHS
jgi:hypothetical protein